MLTKITIRNFKRFDEVEIELGNPVVFIGPNNSGKTSAMQALALWELGVKRWNEKRSGQSGSKKRPGVVINRRDLVVIPHPAARLLWHDMRVREANMTNGRRQISNVRIELIVDGVTGGEAWQCGMEFDFANQESIYCRPMLVAGSAARMSVPDQAGSVQLAFLPAMSGLAASETRLDSGAVNVRVGEGRTAEVLRNLCYAVLQESPEQWAALAEQMESLFGVQLQDPIYIDERGEITMQYKEQGILLDLSSSGRGLQQTLLILTYMAANPGAILLFDEPDAHLEILRQRQIYNLLTETAASGGNQIITATHSEVLLNEAAGKDLAIAFVGKPHAIGNQGSQVRKALAEIGFDQNYQAESTGWVLYLEGSTDIAILRTLAQRLKHAEAMQALTSPFVHYVGNQPRQAESHFFSLREAVPALQGLAIYDRLQQEPPANPQLEHLTWQRREIENYICTEGTLLAFARSPGANESAGQLFTEVEAGKRVQIMQDAIAEVSQALATIRGASPWDANVKVSDDFLTPLFAKYYADLDLPNLMAKKEFYELANHISLVEISPEVTEKLDAIASLASKAAS